jgi:hypothetical protein
MQLAVCCQVQAHLHTWSTRQRTCMPQASPSPTSMLTILQHARQAACTTAKVCSVECSSDGSAPGHLGCARVHVGRRDVRLRAHHRLDGLHDYIEVSMVCSGLAAKCGTGISSEPAWLAQRPEEGAAAAALPHRPRQKAQLALTSGMVLRVAHTCTNLRVSFSRSRSDSVLTSTDTPPAGCMYFNSRLPWQIWGHAWQGGGGALRFGAAMY